MKVTLNTIAQLVNGTVIGNPNDEITHFSPIETAGNGAITFLSNSKYQHFLDTSKPSAVLVAKGFSNSGAYTTHNFIEVDDVYTSLSILMNTFANNASSKNGIEQPCFISETAKYGEGVYLGAFSYLGNNVVLGVNVKIYPNCYIGDDTVIGDETIIYAGVKVYNQTKIGKKCIIHSGVVIGSDGFGFAPQTDGSYIKIPQAGNVVIGNYVEIGANTTIDRATLQSTIISDGVKLDNLIQIAHNVEIGSNTAIAAQTGVSGSTKIGERVIIAGQVGVVGHISIAEGSVIGAQSGVSKTIHQPNQKWFGSPIQPLKNALRTQVLFRNLEELFDRVTKVENKLK